MAEVVILNDGETYAAIDGCMILEVPDELLESPELDNYIKENWANGRSVQ